jgi:hypothetical protein
MTLQAIWLLLGEYLFKLKKAVYSASQKACVLLCPWGTYLRFICTSLAGSSLKYIPNGYVEVMVYRLCKALIKIALNRL